MKSWVPVILVLMFSAVVHSADDRPNILLILCDDLGYSDLGCYGGEIRTPHLDKLAKEGMRFTQFYNAAVCVTTRSALLTGLYPRQKQPPRLRSNMITLGEAMRAAGYATALTGKWHLGNKPPLRPIDRGFDEYYGLLDGCCNFFNPTKQDPVFYNGGRFRTFAHNKQIIKEFPEGFYTTDAFSEHAIETLRNFAKEDRPFLLHLCYTAPHFPLQAPSEDIKRYRGRYARGYHALRAKRYQRQQKMGLFESMPKLSPADSKKSDFRYDYDVPDWETLSESERKREEARMEVYAAMVDRLDQGIGRVLSELDRLGIAKNTLVMFLSDNGGCASWPRPRQQAGFEKYNKGIPVGDRRGYEFVGKGWGWAQNAPFRRFKTWCYEGGIATPMIARWPGKIKASSITHQVGHIIDMMPTLLELSNSSYPKKFAGNVILPVEGKSLLPILLGKERRPHQSICWELYGNRAIREGDWKLVWGAGVQKWELYNLKQDRSETINLADKNPERVTRMTHAWHVWQSNVESVAVP